MIINLKPLKRVCTYPIREYHLKGQANYKLDFRGKITSFSLLELSSIFKEMKPDETIEILGQDPEVQKVLFKILPNHAYQVMIAEAMDEGNGYRIQLRKKI